MSAGPAITQSVTLGTITNAGPTTIHTSYTPILSYNLEHSRQLCLIIIINAPKIFALYMSNYVCGRKEKVFKLFSSICWTLFSKVVRIVFFFINLLDPQVFKTDMSRDAQRTTRKWRSLNVIFFHFKSKNLLNSNSENQHKLF